MTPRNRLDELGLIRRRTRVTVTASLVGHLLLFLLIPLHRSDPPEEQLVEIVWLEEPAPPAPAPEAPAPPAPKTEKSPEGRVEPTRTAPQEKRVQLVRSRPEAPVKPEPQRSAAKDLVRTRLASLDPSAVSRRTQVASVQTPRFERATVPAPVAPSAEEPREMVRKANPAELPRSLPVAEASLKPRILEQLAAAPPEPTEDETLVRQVLAGATLSGPVADRPLLSYRKPDYPDAAKREALEGSVRLHFFVLPDGGVKENVLVERTSGFEEFDRNALLALLDWRFEPLPTGATGEQWGTITLNYRLDDSR